MSTPLRQKMIEDMQLRGLAERTQASYVAAVRGLAEYYGKSPAKLSEPELRAYFLYLKNEKQVAASTCMQVLCALKFLYQHTLGQPWPILDFVKPVRETKLPVVLSRVEVQRLLGCLRQPHYRVCLSTIYSCGLRLLEGVSLQVKDIDSSRMVVHVRGGKGGKDRYVPLPERTLEQLRWYWRQHRHRVWLFPGREFGARGPMDASGVQKAFRAARHESGLRKAASVPTLRHSYATHLLEAGVRKRAADPELSGARLAGHDGHLSAPDPEGGSGGGRGAQPTAGGAAVSEVAEVFREYGGAYRAKYGERMPPSHLKAMSDIEHCRTEVLGGHVYVCDDCQERLYSYHSCGNRHCPKCQQQAGQQWLERQQALLLPVPYFMVTFTLPEPLRALARRHQQVMYDLLFRTAAAALQELAQDRRFVGGQIGLVGVLQTWGRDLSYHPHVHFLVPGGGLSVDGQHWLASRPTFLVHVKPLGQLFRAKFRAGLQQTELFQQVPAQVWGQDWVVHSEAVGTGQAALKYLAPYIFRVAISNNRIVKVAEGQVTFRYTPSGRQKSQVCTLPAEEFIRRFLQHVLPKGFVKVRSYGLFAPGQRPRLQQARALLAVQLSPDADPELDLTATEVEPEPGGPAERLCPGCGRPMRRQTLPRCWPQAP